MGADCGVNVDSGYILRVRDLKSFLLFEHILANCVCVGRSRYQDFHCGLRCC